MKELYVLIYTDICICDFKIFNNLNDPLKIFLKYSINETKKLMDEKEIEETEENDDENSESSISSIDNEMICTLQILNLDKTNEYKLIKDFDINFFQEFLEKKEDFEEYITYLEDNIEKEVIPNDILEIFRN